MAAAGCVGRQAPTAGPIFLLAETVGGERLRRPQPTAAPYPKRRRPVIVAFGRAGSLGAREVG